MDMLRYDACYPENTNSAMALASTDYRNIREVKLISTVRGATDGRWESFGWIVKHQESRIY